MLAAYEIVQCYGERLTPLEIVLSVAILVLSQGAYGARGHLVCRSDPLRL